MGSRDPVLEFGDPIISRERLKLETSSLARRRIVVSTNEKMQNWVKRVMWGSRDPLLEFRDPLISRERLKLETSNLARGRIAVSTNEKKCKIRSKGVMWGHVTHF